MPKLGVISGSGLEGIPGLEIIDSVVVDTPYGEPSDAFRLGRLYGKDIVFLPRHGPGHRLQPHRINYRANIHGFKDLGVERIISLNAAGGISPSMEPGRIAMPDQIIDMTSGRKSTFYEEDEVVHVDFTEPFCPDLRKSMLIASELSGIPLLKSGVYICVNGPRLESAGEIKTFSLWGADMVGMTAMPEAALAREAEICFSALAVITNFAAGISGDRLTTKEVLDTMRRSMKELESLLSSFFALDLPEPDCSCREALRDSRM